MAQGKYYDKTRLMIAVSIMAMLAYGVFKGDVSFDFIKGITVMVLGSYFEPMRNNTGRG